MDDKENKLYSDFATRDVLDGISADNFDSLKNEAFITPENKQFFDDMLRVGWLSGQLSSSGPMPNTAIIQQVDETAGSGNNFYTILQPSAGEVYQLIGVSTGAVAATRVELVLYDGTNYVEVGAESAAATQFDPIINPIFIDNNVYLQAFVVAQTGQTVVNAAFIRVR